MINGEEMATRTETITIRCTEGLKCNLKVLAALELKSVSSYVVDILEQFAHAESECIAKFRKLKGD